MQNIAKDDTVSFWLSCRVSNFEEVLEVVFFVLGVFFFCLCFMVLGGFGVVVLLWFLFCLVGFFLWKSGSSGVPGRVQRCCPCHQGWVES